MSEKYMEVAPQVILEYEIIKMAFESFLMFALTFVFRVRWG